MPKIRCGICALCLMMFALLIGCGAAKSQTETALPSEPAAVSEPAPQTASAALPVDSQPEKPAPQEGGQTEDTGSDILVAWFSVTGTTKGIAEQLVGHLSADSFEIAAREPYTEADLDYSNSGCRASVEQKDESARPAVSGEIADISRYSTVFIGYPIWYGQAPRIISTFLESNDFSGKTIIPFCTSGSSGIGTSAENLRSLAGGADWREGRRFAAGTPNGEITQWADEAVGGETLYIQIGARRLTAKLENNSSAKALVKLLKNGPLTVDMSDYGSFEKVGELGAVLPQNDENITTSAGDLILYQGSRFVIYYDTNTWNFTMLGKINDASAEELKSILGAGDITAVLSID